MDKQYLMGETILKKEDPNASKTVSSLTMVFWVDPEPFLKMTVIDYTCMHELINNT